MPQTGFLLGAFGLHNLHGILQSVASILVAFGQCFEQLELNRSDRPMGLFGMERFFNGPVEGISTTRAEVFFA